MGKRVFIAQRVVHWLRVNRDLNIWVGIPILLFLMDLIVRVSLHLDVVDIGADLAFLSVSVFISSLAENKPLQDSDVKVAFLLFFLMIWLICLSLTSPFSQFASMRIRSFIAMGVGLMSLILASVFLAELTKPSWAPHKK